MAARVSIGSGNWSASGTWGAAAPTSGDGATITAGHTVIFNVNQSAWTAGLSGLAVNGTLSCMTSAGTAYLKVSANITGTGRIAAGDPVTPLPSGTSFFIDFVNGARYINSNTSGFLALYGYAPSIVYTTLASAASTGATSLIVSDNLSTDRWLQYWGKEIAICNVNKAQQIEYRTINTITSSSITITSGLTNSKLVGTVIALLNRNITLCNSTSYLINASTYAQVNGVCLSGGSYHLYSGSDGTITNSVICKGTGGTNSYSRGYFYNNVAVGNTYGWYSNMGSVFSSGVVAGNGTGLNYMLGCSFDTMHIDGNNTGGGANVDCIYNNSIFKGNQIDFSYSNLVYMNNCNLDTYTYGILHTTAELNECMASGGGTCMGLNSVVKATNTDFRDAEDKIVFWTRNSTHERWYLDSLLTTGATSGVRTIYNMGGIITLSGYTDSVDTTHPSLGKVASWRSKNSSVLCWLEEPIQLRPYETISITLYGQTTSANTDIPKAYLFDRINNPLISNTFTPLATTSFQVNPNLLTKNQQMFEDSTTHLWTRSGFSSTVQTSDVATGFTSAITLSGDSPDGGSSLFGLLNPKVTTTIGSAYSIGMWMKSNYGFRLKANWGIGTSAIIVSAPTSAWQYVSIENMTAPATSMYLEVLSQSTQAGFIIKMCGAMACTGATVQTWVPYLKDAWQSNTLQYTNPDPVHKNCNIRITCGDPSGTTSYLWYRKHSKTQYQQRI